jgi:hypothetical protein
MLLVALLSTGLSSSTSSSNDAPVLDMTVTTTGK